MATSVTTSRTSSALRAAAVVFSTAACGADAPSRGGAPRSAPNVLLYIADTLRADELGCYGNPEASTPRLDELAAEGTLFTRAIAPSSWTRPSVATILSGLPPTVHGAEGRHHVLEEGVVLLSELFRDAGYATANVTTNRNVGAFFGFDQGYSDGGFIEMYERSAEDVVQVGELIAEADEVTARAVEWLDSVTGPFCIVVHSIDPHAPYMPPGEWDIHGARRGTRFRGTIPELQALDESRTPEDELRARALYRGEISFNDDAFGALVDHLEARGSYDDTITLFTSDHGEEFWERGVQGHSKNVNERTLHVPLIVRYPGVVEAGAVVRHLTASEDILPTLLELAGLDLPPWLEGRSLFAEPDPERAVYSSLVLRGRELRSIRTDDWKLIWNVTTTRRRLYDMRQTDVEQSRVLGERERLEQLYAELEQQHERERARRVELFGAEEAPRVDEIPDAVADELEALGYLGDEDVSEGEAEEDEPGSE